MKRRDLGSVTVSPSRVPAGETVELMVRYRVGAAGMSAGGGVRVQLPDAWHDYGANTAKAIQTRYPDLPGFVDVRTTAGTVRLSIEGSDESPNKQLRKGLDGQHSRYVYVCEVTVQGSRLERGDTIELVFGPDEGFVAGFFADGPEQVLVAVDIDGDDNFEMVSEPARPRLEIVERSPSELVVIAPSVVGVNDRRSIRVVALDSYGNPCVLQEPPDLQAGTHMRIEQSVPGQEGRWWEWHFEVAVPGATWVTASTDRDLVGRSNPIEVVETGSRRNLYWGDLHSHSVRSLDGFGRHPFQYARNVALLDFYALTDHCEGWETGAWESVRGGVAANHQPHQFVTLLAYEATFGGPWGHHNVYLRGEDGPVVGSDIGTLLDLYTALESQEAIVIPHHPGISFSAVPQGALPGNTRPNPDWSYHDIRLRRLIEIYSGHGQSELYDPLHDLSYENCGFDNFTSQSVDGPFYAQDAWSQDLRLGVVGGSDNHHAQPGRGELGLTGVWADSLTRDAIFDALIQRRCYATTGARVILQWSIDDIPMGGVVQERARRGRVRVIGTGSLDSVEVVAIDLVSHKPITAAFWTPDGEIFEEEWDIDPPFEDGLYYLRVRQRDTYRGRAVMGWSSPIWIKTQAE